MCVPHTPYTLILRFASPTGRVCGVATHAVAGNAGYGLLNTALTEQGSLSLAVIKFSAAEAALTDADGNALKQEELFFTVEKE